MSLNQRPRWDLYKYKEDYALSRVINTMRLEDVLYGIDGTLFPKEAEALRKLATEVSPEFCIVELGSYRGRSTLALLHGMNENVKLYSVDPRKDIDGKSKGIDQVVFQRNLMSFNCQDLVYPISLEADLVGGVWIETGNPQVGLLLVNYGFEVYKAIRSWLYNLHPNAVIAIKNYASDENKEAIANFNQLQLFDVADTTGFYHLIVG